MSAGTEGAGGVGPVPVFIRSRSAQAGAAVTNGDGTASLRNPLDLQGLVVGAATVRQKPDGAHVVINGEEGRRTDRDTESRRFRAGISHVIGGDCLEVVAAVGQRPRRQCPVAPCVRDHRIEKDGTRIHLDRASCLGGSADHQGVVHRAGTPGNSTLVAQHAGDPGPRRGQVDDQVESSAAGADVAGRVRGRGGEAVAAFCQRRRKGQAPHAVGTCLGRAHQLIVGVVHPDGASCLSGTLKRRRYVISSPAAAHVAQNGARIVRGTGDDRGVRGHRVHDIEREGSTGNARIASRVGRLGGQRVRPRCQGRHGQAPRPLPIGCGRPNQHSALVHLDGAASLSLARDDGLLPRHGAANDRRQRSLRVHSHAVAVAQKAVVAAAEHRGRQLVLALAQGLGRESPGATVVGGHTTQLRGAVIDDHDSTACRRAAEGQRRVIGRIGGREIADLAASDVVTDGLDHGRRGQSHGTGHRDAEGRTALAARLGRDAVAAHGQRRRGKAPGSTRIGRNAAQQNTPVEKSHGAASGGHPRQQERAVIGAATVCQIASGALVIEDREDDGFAHENFQEIKNVWCSAAVHKTDPTRQDKAAGAADSAFRQTHHPQPIQYKHSLK